jgi:DNA repair photolyase
MRDAGLQRAVPGLGYQCAEAQGRRELIRELDPDAVTDEDLPASPLSLRPPPRPRASIAIPPVPAGRSNLPEGPRKGRGATVNPPNRFEALAAAPFDDGWNTMPADLADLPPLTTTLIRDASRSVISYNQSPDIGFDRAINPYRGCEHGCVYCYARPSHAYLGYSPGLDFETKLLFKPDVAELLEKELCKPGYVPRPIALGSNTDPYQPVDRTLKLTRSVLEVLDRANHPVTIVTKSAGVLRDMDILARMAERKLVRVCISVTTLDSTLARRMEPRAATPARRLHAIGCLARMGIPTGVLVAPMIPALNDAEMEKILEAAAREGAKSGGYILLRLPHELKQIFEDWLNRHFPDRARHVLQLIRETRAGGLNQAKFGLRFSGSGVYADMLARRFERAARRLGLESEVHLDTSQFVPPHAPEQERTQLSLF